MVVKIGLIARLLHYDVGVAADGAARVSISAEAEQKLE
jgi:hypothetical protein